MARLIAALLLAATWTTPSAAQSPKFLEECRRWIDQKGYSTDYIEQKTGKRQPGLAGSWRGNTRLDEIQAGDVELVRLRAPGAMHAAIAEEIKKNPDGTVASVRVSEWNWGPMKDQRCLVTENFGRLASGRWIQAPDIAEVWRP